MSKKTEFIIDHITKEISERNLSELDLKTTVGLCSWNLIYCNKCVSTLANFCEQLSNDKIQCVKLDYSKYKSIWYVYNLYQRFRNRITISYQITRYQKIYYLIINIITTEHDNIYFINLDQTIFSSICFQFLFYHQSSVGNLDLIHSLIGVVITKQIFLYCQDQKF